MVASHSRKFTEDELSTFIAITGASRPTAVAFLHELRDMVLRGSLEKELSSSEIHDTHVTVRADYSPFALEYERSALELDQLTEHQEEPPLSSQDLALNSSIRFISSIHFV